MFNLLSELYDARLAIDRRVREIVRDAKLKVARSFGIPEYLLKLKGIIITRLPEIYETGVERIGNYYIKYRRRIGKILGMFDPASDIAYIDPINLSNEKLLRKTIIHEMVHLAQKILGKVYRFPRSYLEKEAYSATEELMT